MVDADRQLESLIAGAADPGHIDVDDSGPIILGIAAADIAQHALDDVDVMFSPIEAAHTVC